MGALPPLPVKGSSEKESWSVVEDRIHGWWQLTTPPEDSEKRALVENHNGIMARTRLVLRERQTCVHNFLDNAADVIHGVTGDWLSCPLSVIYEQPFFLFLGTCFIG